VANFPPHYIGVTMGKWVSVVLKKNASEFKGRMAGEKIFKVFSP